MITHLVFFKMKPEARGATAESNRDEAIRRLNALNGTVDAIQSLSAGQNLAGGEGCWDLGLTSTFASRSDLERYQTHPEHVAVKEFLLEACSEIAVVDFES